MVDVRALSRRMVKALRHAPVGEGGWLPVSWLATTYGCSEAEILAAAGPEGSPGKTRFVTADLGGTTCVKALQGHSSATGVSVQELYLRADHEHFTETYGPNNVPDLMLAHGTFGRHVESIRSGGLLPGGGTTDRQTTHFALTTRGAFLYPLNLMRRSADVVLVASLEAILQSGITLYCGAEGVYLTDQAVDPGQLSAWSVLTGGRQGDLLFGSADRGLIVRPDRQEAIQRLEPLSRSFSQSSQGGLTGPGVKQYLGALAAHSARYQGKAPAASTASSKGTAARAVYDEPAIPPTVAEFRTEQVRERAGAPRAPPARSAKVGASEAPPAKKAGAIEVRPIAPPASTATATASGRGTDPPADWKGLIDKTALLAAAVGPGFEKRTLREHDQNKYRFLLADHQYHPYYLEQRERAAKERAERESSRGSAAVPEEDDESAPPPLPAPAEPPTGYVSLDDEESVEVEESGEEEFGGDDDSFYPDDRGQPLRLKSRSRSRSRSRPVEPVRAVVKPKATPPWRRPGGFRSGRVMAGSSAGSISLVPQYEESECHAALQCGRR